MQLQIVQKTVLVQPKPNVQLSDEEERYYQILNTASTPSSLSETSASSLSSESAGKGIVAAGFHCKISGTGIESETAIPR